MDSAQTLFCCGSSWMPCPLVYIAPKGRGKERWGEGRGRAKIGRRKDKANPAHLFNTLLWTKHVLWIDPLGACFLIFRSLCQQIMGVYLQVTGIVTRKHFFFCFLYNILQEGRQRWRNWGRGESNSYLSLACYTQGLIYSIPCSMTVSF